MLIKRGYAYLPACLLLLVVPCQVTLLCHASGRHARRRVHTMMLLVLEEQ
ncbi:hypothetical protein [Thermogemmatispora sp.]|nr:hypothetical protein [Thermogemmatispora sp.]MBX5449557.1 hypothetical protein [Thermogemmatispora sp.]